MPVIRVDRIECGRVVVDLSADADGVFIFVTDTKTGVSRRAFVSGSPSKDTFARAASAAFQLIGRWLSDALDGAA